jgi:DNA-binding response OmpR family regulator
MTPETRAIPNDRKPEEPVILSDFRPPEAHHSVILVADDNGLVRNLVGLLMQHDGHFILSAADGSEGLDLSRQYPGAIDLVITDVEMPRMNGADLCAHLLEERPGINILVMSGGTTREVLSQNVTLPFLHKPFDGKTLRAKVRTILAAPRRLTDLTTLLSDLHSELKQIDREIISGEQSARRTNKAGPRSVTDDP